MKLSKKKFGNIEALRGLAAMYVVMHHCQIGRGTWLSYFTMQGQVAVMLFFIVSGFVIYYSVHKYEELSFKEYFWKRFKRIYFIFILALVISYLAACIKAGDWLNPNPKQLLVNLLNLQDLRRHPGYIDIGYFSNAPLWSLSYEWWFYMIFFPIFKYVKSSYQNILAFAISLFGVLSYWVYPNMFSIIFWYFIIWWWGVILAKTYIKHEGVFELKNIKLIPFSFAIMMGVMALMIYQFEGELSFGQHPIIQMRHFIYSFGLLFIGWLWYKFKMVGFSRLIGPFEIFAPISYSIYVFHYPILHQLRKSFFDQIWIHYIVAIFISIGLSYLAEKKLYPYVSKKL